MQVLIKVPYASQKYIPSSVNKIKVKMPEMKLGYSSCIHTGVKIYVVSNH